jgi:PAS domain S-box-containing protein
MEDARDRCIGGRAALAELGFELPTRPPAASDANTIAATGGDDGLGVGGDDHVPAEWLDPEQRAAHRALAGQSGTRERATAGLGAHPEAHGRWSRVPAILYIDRPDELSTNLYTSPQIEPILGFSVTEWVADPELWRKQLHPDDRAQALDTHRRSNAAATPYLDEYRILTKDGRTLWIRDEAWPVLSEDGSILFWRGVMLDITERKEAEDKLRWSLDILRRTLQQRRELAQRLQHAQGGGAGDRGRHHDDRSK